MENKEQYQALWDKLLISGWRKNKHMLVIFAEFLAQANPSHLCEGEYANNIADVNTSLDWFATLGLRRCLDRNRAGYLVFGGYNRPAHAFVSDRCTLLNNCLWNDKNSEEEILASINSFRWVRKSPKAISKQARERKARFNEEDQTRSIKARSLTKTNWNTVS